MQARGHRLMIRACGRFGYYYDESPQPTEGVGPLLPDADRNGFTVGYGFNGGRVQQDYYVLYVDFNERTSRANFAGFNGTYESSVLLAGASLGW